MTHYSDICILLRWTPPLEGVPDSSQSPPRRLGHASPQKLGYRVYVNGVVEGMVQKALFTSSSGDVHLFFFASYHNIVLCLSCTGLW